MSSSKRDQLYAYKQDNVEDFIFDEQVASVFEDMIQRSVPGYILLNQLLPIVAKQYIQNDSNIYDLGCSLGEASIALANMSEYKNLNIFAIDNSSAMINRLDEKISTLNINQKIETQCEDITNIEINNSSFVVLNYTLQFVERSKREDLLRSIYKGLVSNGAFLLSEKIAYADEDEDLLMQQLHENYKRINQYSELEISQKREALDQVLIRDTHEQHIQRLRTVGFSKVSILCKYLNFVTYLVTKH